MKVTFETKCYHRDWRFLVKDDLLRRMIDNCNYKFEERILYINNFPHYSAIKGEADKLISKGVIDKYVVVEEYASEVLEAFDLTLASFKGGYYYSIAELVSIYLCNTDYLLHFSSDSIQEGSQFNWIASAIDLMQVDRNIVVANPLWNTAYREAESESFGQDKNWFYSFGFSDQAYLIRTSDFKKPVYNEYNPVSDRYPKYGGELFEKRVDSYMRNHNLVRITSKDVSYQHENFPKINRWDSIVNRLKSQLS